MARGSGAGRSETMGGRRIGEASSGYGTVQTMECLAMFLLVTVSKMSLWKEVVWCDQA